MIFARDVDEPLVKLLVKIDEAAAKNRKQEMGAFVVFLSSQEGLAERLKSVAGKHKFKHLVLSIDEPAGPEDYKVAANADVTVVLYREHLVRSNHGFRKGELNDKAIERILADVPKITAGK
jgi:hypothetical protein